MEDCQCLRFFELILIPSTSKVPSLGSSNPSIRSTIVVLPPPVAPTNPTFVFARIFRLIFLMAGASVFG